mgnify:CR=1 FL=1|jgi:transposase InsO family protein
MPWKECKTVEQEREEFVKEVLTGKGTMSALCRKYGISRPTGYKWVSRYINGNNLANQSRAPFHTPRRISAEVEDMIVCARLKEPAIGAVKTKRMLENRGCTNVPSASTINAVFKRNGLITVQASQNATPYKRFEKEEPNEMWQSDFKGDFALRNAVRCYPLSIIDDASRKCLCADAKENMQLKSTMESFISTFRKYGLPKSLLCDNGVPWGSSQSTSITRFETWLMELGILPIHIRMRHPQCQGKVERFNGSYKQERLNFYTPLDMADAQRSRLEYRKFYNSERPHHALGLDVPDSRYKPSPREYQAKVSSWDYEVGGEIRQIKSSGYITFESQGYYLSEGLAGKTVCVYPTDEDGIYDIVFRQFRVARLSLHNRVIMSRRIYLLHDDPRGRS